MKRKPLLEAAGFTEIEFKKFTSAMRTYLIKNMHKGRSWKTDDTDTFLHGKLIEEVGEYLGSKDYKELPDIANICLMLYLRSGI